MATNNTIKKPALFAVLMVATLGTLSNLPGAMDAVHSTDLLLSSKPVYLNKLSGQRRSRRKTAFQNAGLSTPTKSPPT